MKILAVLFLALFCSAAAAQPATPVGAASLGGEATLAVTATSANVALPAPATPFNAITVVNTGTKDAYIAQGASGVAATTSNPVVRAGKHITIQVTGAYLAAICGGTDTTSLDIYQANGPVYFGP